MWPGEMPPSPQCHPVMEISLWSILNDLNARAFLAEELQCCLYTCWVRKLHFIFSTQAANRGEASPAAEMPSPSPSPLRKLHHKQGSTKYPPWCCTPNDPWDKMLFLHGAGSAQGPQGSLDASALAFNASPASRAHKTQRRGTQEHLPVQVMDTGHDTQFLSHTLTRPQVLEEKEQISASAVLKGHLKNILSQSLAPLHPTIPRWRKGTTIFACSA